MVSRDEQATMYMKLLKAAEKDDVRELYMLLAVYPNILQDGALIWEENPLHIASKHNSLEYVRAIIRLKPEFSKERNYGGFTPLHLAAAIGNIAIVIALVELDPELCLIGDKDSKIPLHRAVRKGRVDVVRVLVSACPESLQRVDCLKETALHIALNFKQCDIFKVLMEEIKKHKQEELLNSKDYRGNTILHLATYHNLIQIVELLLASNSTNGIMVQVNSMNNMGLTPLNVLYQSQNHNDIGAFEICRILYDAGAVEGHSSFHGQMGQNSSLHSPTNQSQRRPPKLINDVQAVLLMIVQVTFAILIALTISSRTPATSSQAELHIKNLLWGPSQLVLKFYFLVLITAEFNLAVGTIIVLLWSNEWHPFKTVPVFGLVILVIPYGFLLDMAFPFSVSLASFHIPSFSIVWSSAMALIIVAVAMWHMKEPFRFICNKFVRKAMTGKAIEMVQQ